MLTTALFGGRLASPKTSAINVLNQCIILHHSHAAPPSAPPPAPVWVWNHKDQTIAFWSKLGDTENDLEPLEIIFLNHDLCSDSVSKSSQSQSLYHDLCSDSVFKSCQSLTFGKVALGLLCWFPVLWHDCDGDCVWGLCHSAVWAVRLGLDHVRTNTSLDHLMKDSGRV